MLLNKKKNYIIKSFFNICRNNKINTFFIIKKRIEKKKLKLKYYNKENFEFDLNKSYSQFVYSRLIQQNKFLNTKLINSIANNSNFFFYLPKDWLIEISKEGVKVNFFLSKILWNFFLIFFFLRFYIQIYIIVFFSFFKSNTKKKIYFNDASFYTPSTKQKNFSPSFIDFCSNFISVPSKKILSQFSFVYSYNHFIKNLTILKKINLLIYLNYFSLKIIFHGIFKESDLLIFSKELFFFFFFKKNINLLPEFSFFSNSGLIYRPLWSYIKKNCLESRVYTFFYSNNFISPVIKNRSSKNLKYIEGSKLFSWNKYIFWNRHQLFLFQNVINKTVDYFLSPYNFIPYEGKNIFLKKKVKTLSVFDVHPMNIYGFSVNPLPYNIYTFSYCKKFIDDLIFFQNKYDFNLIIKSKLRNKSFEIFSRRYYVFLQSIRSKKIKIFRSDLSALSVIKISDAIVSIPFSSPSEIAYFEKKKSCYYDPENIILNHHNEKDKVKLISGKINLEKWILKNLLI